MANKPVIPANPERGWGQMLPAYFSPEVSVSNHARNGRSSKSFIAEGRWQAVLDQIRPSDFVIIQFGHNDQKTSDPLRFTAPFGEFKQNLKRYIEDTRNCGGIPLVATPIARRKFGPDGQTKDTHGDYATAVRQVAIEEKAPLLDLERRSRELLNKLGPEPSKRLYDWIDPGEFDYLPEGLKDDTHFNAFGASRICDLAVLEIQSATPELAKKLGSHR